jgi:hypothetical protein
MENIRKKITEIITHTHKTPFEQADEILLLFGVVGRSEQLNAFREWTRENLNQEDVVTQEAIDRYLESI